MRRVSRRSLAEFLSAAGEPRFVADENERVSFHQLNVSTGLAASLDEMRGANVLVATRTQLASVLALVELDGIARRIVLCPPDLGSEHIPDVMTIARVGIVVTDQLPFDTGADAIRSVGCDPGRLRPTTARERDNRTEWVLFTSGTTGRPKMVVHSLASLTDAIESDGSAGGDVWSTFYDIRRYGGLQILLRALIGGGSLVLSSARESTAAFLTRAAANGVSHISGTPSHWRRALMSPRLHGLAPRYVRLSGEVADQAILDRLAAYFPRATVAHAFASTEAGVAFDVRDGLAGFPAGLIGQAGRAVEMRVEAGSLRIRSARTATRYLGDDAPSLVDDLGFIDTSDIVELKDDRYHFVGRREGIINVGGQKVHPEEVEAIINRHPRVEMARVTARRSPITGAIVVAEVTTRAPADSGGVERLVGEILDLCRDALAPHKVPARVRVVESLDLLASGKLARGHA